MAKKTAIRTFGAVANHNSVRTSLGGGGAFRVSTSVQINPSTGETVDVQAGFPKAEVYNGTTFLGSFQLTPSSGNVWNGSGSPFTNPTKVKLVVAFRSMVEDTDADLTA